MSASHSHPADNHVPGTSATTSRPAARHGARRPAHSATQIARHVAQLVSFVLMPGLFYLVWGSIGSVCQAVVTGTASLQTLASPILMLLATVPITMLWGRFFCSYVCSFGAMQELAGAIGSALRLPKLTVPRELDSDLKYLKYLVIALCLALWITQADTSALSPWVAFGNVASLDNVAAALGLGGAVLLAIVICSLFVDRFFCRYLCPLGGVFAVISLPRLFKIRKHDGCVGCAACNRACPMSIDVQNAASSLLRDGECIDCFGCVDACPAGVLATPVSPAVSGSLAAATIVGLTYVGNVAVDALGDAHAAAASEQTSSQTTGAYQDGTYQGTAQGYRGPVSVTVTVANGNITSIQVDSFEDDEEFFSRAESQVIGSIMDSQSVSVAPVTGATYSSQGIMDAVANALGKDALPNQSTTDTATTDGGDSSSADGSVPGTGTIVEPSATTGTTDFSSVADGTYTGQGQGRNGTIAASVTVSGGQVTAVEVTSSQEDAPYLSAAESQVIAEVLSQQSIDVDTATGATMSSNGILEAIADALGLEFDNPNQSMAEQGHRGR